MGEDIAVVGATGYTGGLVVRELVRRGAGVVAVGRDPDKLRHLPAEVEPRVADVTDAAALAASLDGCGAVVSCVGSFVDLGEAVVSAAVAASVPYVDTAAEFPFLQRVFDRHDGPARTAGVAVVPGMAFYSAPADMAAALAARALRSAPETVEITYRLAGARPSRGTLRTNLRRAGLPCPVWEDGRLVWRRVGGDQRSVAFPEPHGPVSAARWPGGEVLSVPRHTGARSVAVFVGMPPAVAAVLRNGRLVARLQPLGRVLVGRGTDGPAEAARRRARFVVVVDCRAGGGSARAVLDGHDLYGLSAAACAEAAQRLAGAADRPAGVLAPAEAFDPAGFLEALAGYLSWRVEPSGRPAERSER